MVAGNKRRCGLLFIAAVLVLATTIAAPVCARASVFLRRSAEQSVTARAAEWPFSDIAVPADFSPTFAITSADGGFSMASGRYRGPVETVAAVLRTALSGSGWMPCAPTENFDGAAFWTRGKFVAVSSATPAADGDGCVWIVVRQRR